MIDYTQWKRHNTSVSTLLLDPENPRIPPNEEDLSQGELLAELIKHDQVYELAKKIVNNGYYTDESLITTPRDGRLIVLEGNRRVAALKSLLSPDAAPEEYQKKFRALSANIPASMIKTIPVTISPSRDAALPRIAEKHTKSLLEEWKPAQQARFYRTLLEQGKSVSDICENFGLTEGELSDFLKLDTLYQMACSLDLPEDVQKKVENPRKFPITNLERFMDSQSGRDFLAIESDAKYGFKGNVSASEFKKGFTKVVTDVAEGRVTSRDLNDAKAIKTYLKEIKDYAPNKQNKGSFKAHDLIKKPEKPSDIQPTKQKRTGGSRTSKRLFLSDLKCGVDNQRIHDVFNELRRFKINEYPNSVAVMIRVLLELTSSHFIHHSGKTSELIQECDPKKKKPDDWHPFLRQQLKFMLNKMKLPLEPLELKALRPFVEDTKSPMTLAILDGFIHNKNLHPTETDIRAVWAIIEPLMRIILIEPKQ